MNGLLHLEESDCSEFVEVDPTGRYGRYNEILGKGASKTVSESKLQYFPIPKYFFIKFELNLKFPMNFYSTFMGLNYKGLIFICRYRAFDEYEGIEVAWNQVKLYDFLQSPEDLERLYCEIHLLKTLKHKNIMKFYTSWVDTANRNINFVTEMFTSGTLRQYRLKHKRVNIRAVKHWCRQILSGLLYLHSHDPPVIHRDLKCDNIFVNGNQGEVKIGDLGLAAILRKSHAAHCVGTPEFMAPEVYEEAYNELVDIYSFGMCVLEMVTFEYPYSECTHPAQIYKKVISGRKPDALYKVKDPEVRQFVEKCLATVSLRLSARELLNDPFLQIDDCESDFRQLEYAYGREYDDMGPFVRLPSLKLHHSSNSYGNGYSNGYGYETSNEWGYHPAEIEPSGIELFEYQEDEHAANVDVSIKGKMGDDDGIFLRLRIVDKEGRIRNIYFPFDVETDTALSVATEMVAELDITDQDATKIADMIDGEIASLVPEWRLGPGIEETPRFSSQNFCHNCASNRTSTGSLLDFLTHNGVAKDSHLLRCCRTGCASMHGRFEEITFQVEESEHCVTDGAPNESSQSDHLHYQEIWDQQESHEHSLEGSRHRHSDEESEKLDQSLSANNEKDAREERKTPSPTSNPIQCSKGSHSFSTAHSLYCDIADNYENEVQQELRWLKAKYQMELRELRDQQLVIVSDSSNCSNKDKNRTSEASSSSTFSPNKHSNSDFHDHNNKSFPNSDNRGERYYNPVESPRVKNMVPAQNFFTGSLLPHSLHRTTSLPVDAVDI